MNEHFAINVPASVRTVDHAVWDRLLAAYVVACDDGVNRFAYGRVSAADKAALKAYIAALQAETVTALNADEQRAFWINLYNALTVDVVLDHYPVKSIRDISFASSGERPGPWREKLATVEGFALSLNDIEHKILRRLWADPRVHYAINCGSTSCPNLPAKAFTRDALDGMLAEGARDYINHPRALSRTDGGLAGSQIFAWYRDDFGASDAAMIDHLKLYAAPDLKAALERVTTIDNTDYDWSLNEAK